MAEKSYVKFLRGSLANYKALETKDVDTLYFAYNEDQSSTALYLGSRLIAGTGEILGANNLDELDDVLIKTIANKDILMYNSEESRWENVTLETLISEIKPLLNVAASTQIFQGELQVTTNDDGSIIKETQEAALVRLPGENAVLNKGDIAILKDLVADGKYQYTAYVYDGSIWVAMDGNYNADNIYFDEDFVFTKAIGTVTIPSSGSKTVNAKGKSVKQFFAGLFAAEAESSVTKPSISAFSINKAGNYEAGTPLTNLTYTATFDDGKYTYGPEPTGSIATAWTIKDNAGNSVGTTATGELNNYVVPGDGSFYLKATADYSNGDYAKTNLGNVSTKTRIAAGTTSNEDSNAINGYWQYFYGILDVSIKNDVATNITSAFIRENLTHGGAYAAGVINLNAHEGAKCLIVACPASKTGITEAIMPSALQSSIPWIGGSPFTISVDGATDAVSTNYNVWIYEPASIDATETYKITLE